MSQQEENNKIVSTSNSEDDGIDIKKILSTVINNWILFIVSIIICLSIAVIYGKYSSRDWHIASKILVEDQKNGPSSAIQGSLNSDISSLFNVKSSADNEIQILKSRSLMASVVKQLNLNIRTFHKAGLKPVEIYNESPFDVAITYRADTLNYRNYKITIINNNEYEISNTDEDFKLKANFNKTIRLKQYDITLRRTNINKGSGEYSIAIESIDAAISNFSSIFTAALSDKQSTTIDLYFSYPHPKKGEAILDALMKQYLLSNLQNKVQIADSTMTFINKEIDMVFDGLSGTEKEFEQYKETNNIVDINEQSKALVASSKDYYDKLNQQTIQLNIINDMQKLLSIPGNKKLLPTALLITSSDQSFGQLINIYNELLIQRDRASLAYTDSNPAIINYDTQLSNARANILKNLESYRDGLLLANKQLKAQNGDFTNQLKNIPSKQRIYLDYARKQQLKQELYLFLLQKREETAISKTSTISSSRIIDYAKSDYSPYKPNKNMIYLMGLIIGLVIPSIYLFVKDLLNIKITTKSDIEKITAVPIIGEINHNVEEKSLIVTNNSRSIISEQFKSLRTNLQYAIDSSKSNVLLFTSSMSGEGKSFLSLNLGSTLALTGKKVIFLELDLRKPKLSESMGLDNSNGFTNFIISKSIDLTSIIKKTWFNDNCSLISSGPIPPNPSELLISDKVGEMVETLKKEYDYVVIDSAPIGLVTDALLLEKYADVTFYVVRQGYTYKSQLNILNDLKHNKKVKNLYLIVNDIQSSKSPFASYGQGYGYGYGYGSYGEDEKAVKKGSWWKRK